MVWIEIYRHSNYGKQQEKRDFFTDSRLFDGLGQLIHGLVAVCRVKALTAFEDGEEVAVIIRWEQFTDGLS